MRRVDLSRLAIAVGLLTIVGCGGPKFVPVSGTATTADGKPLAGLVISFNADASKGHPQPRVACDARIGPDGRFTMRSDDGFKQYKGAMAGWYRVTLSAPDDQVIPANKKYTAFKSSDLFVEVVENPAPGAYDLKFSK